MIGDAELLDSIPTEQLEDQAVVDHIEQAMRNDPDGYARSLEAQKTYGEALERLNAPRPAAEPGGPVFSDPAYRLAVRGHDEKRRSEIETAMRVDGGRAYWNNPPMQREYGEILGHLSAPVALPSPAAEPEQPTA